MPSTKEMDPSHREVVDLSVYYLDMVQCPLNPTHQLRRHKLLHHLVKCRKSYPEKIQSHDGQITNNLQTCSSKPKISNAGEMPPKILEVQNAMKKNINYNYDIDNFTIEEPFWD